MTIQEKKQKIEEILSDAISKTFDFSVDTKLRTQIHYLRLLNQKSKKEDEVNFVYLNAKELQKEANIFFNLKK